VTYDTNIYNCSVHVINKNVWLTSSYQIDRSVCMRAYECVSFGMWFCVAGEVVNSAVQEKFFFDCLALKMKALQPFETLWTTQTTTHHHIPEDFTLKQWHTFLFLNKQTTLLCICGLTLQNKKHNTHNSLNHTAIYIMIQHLKLCTFPTECIHMFLQFSE